MLDLALLAGFFLTSVAIELTPGPNMAYLALVGVSRGRADGMMAVLGVAVGLALLGAIVGVGVGSLILENRFIYETLRWAGAAYLLWLAWDGWRDAQRETETGALPVRKWVYFRRGFVTNLLNPKAALFFITVMPGFMDPAASLNAQTTVLVATYVLAATAIHAVIVLLASTLTPFFKRPDLRKATALVFAVMLVGVAIWLLIKTAV
ncbi:LysE family translocator [Devosia sp.]|uniref:LysE family translocator n=1 Tax=Devosia sp. TaxID=1871048 RepID=UPI003A8E845E